MKIVRLLNKTGFLTTWIFFGLIVAYVCALRLRFAPPFRSLFARTCFYIPHNEVAPTLAILLVGFVSAVACLVVLFRRSAELRQRILGVLFATITFTVGVFLTAWI